MMFPRLSGMNAIFCAISSISIGPPIRSTPFSASSEIAASRSSTARQKWCRRAGSMLLNTSSVGACRFVAPAISSIFEFPQTRKTKVVPCASKRWSTLYPSLLSYHSIVGSRSSAVTLKPTWSCVMDIVMGKRLTRNSRANQETERRWEQRYHPQGQLPRDNPPMTKPRTSLGATLRAWRDRVSPAAVGLPSGHNRRASGLRREELADLAGVSVDYVVRLEQGRSTSPSEQVVAALARALQVTDTERDHLYRLAGLAAPTAAEISDHLPPGLQRLLQRLDENAAAAVFAADWQMIWWNRGWAALLGDPSSKPFKLRNFARDTFPTFPTDAGGPHLSHWPVTSVAQSSVESAVVADLRRASGRFPGSKRLQDLIEELAS